METPASDNSPLGSLLAAAAAAAATPGKLPRNHLRETPRKKTTESPGESPAPLPNVTSLAGTPHHPTQLPAPSSLRSRIPTPHRADMNDNAAAPGHAAHTLPAIPAAGVEARLPRKGARVFNREEKLILEDAYAVSKFPDRVILEDLGARLGKGAQKVRTWFNNRRATERKEEEGEDVVRRPAVVPGLVKRPTSSTADAEMPSDATPPGRAKAVFGSQVTPHGSQDCSQGQDRPQSRDETPALPQTQLKNQTQTPSHVKNLNPASGTARRARRSTSLPSPTPLSHPLLATPRPPSAPATPPGDGHGLATYKPPPLKLRRISLRVAESKPSLDPVALDADSVILCGADDPSGVVDDGLELKFLFGKRRVVYEWYVGAGKFIDEAKETGGPYAKVELPFAALHTFRLERDPASGAQTLTMGMSQGDPPALFVQTDTSVRRFQTRSQQRQYVKVAPADFPQPRLHSASTHIVAVRADDAARLRAAIVSAECHELAAMLSVGDENVSTSPHAAALAVVAAARPVQLAADGDARHSSLPTLENIVTVPVEACLPPPTRAISCPRPSIPQTPQSARDGSIGLESQQPAHNSVHHRVPECHRPLNQASLLPISVEPRSWYSPATPAEGMSHGLHTAAAQIGATQSTLPATTPASQPRRPAAFAIPSPHLPPLNSSNDTHHNRLPTTPISTPFHVRRELSRVFADEAPRLPEMAVLTRKRKGSDMTGDENDSGLNNRNRPRLASASSLLDHLRGPGHPHVPPPPPPPLLPAVHRITDPSHRENVNPNLKGRDNTGSV